MLTCYLLNGTLLAKTWTVAPLVTSGLVSSVSNPGFKVAVYLQVEYFKNGAFRDKVTKEH